MMVWNQLPLCNKIILEELWGRSVTNECVAFLRSQTDCNGGWNPTHSFCSDKHCYSYLNLVISSSLTLRFYSFSFSCPYNRGRHPVVSSNPKAWMNFAHQDGCLSTCHLASTRPTQPLTRLFLLFCFELRKMYLWCMFTASLVCRLGLKTWSSSLPELCKQLQKCSLCILHDMTFKSRFILNMIVTSKKPMVLNHTASASVLWLKLRMKNNR